jgi:hypothetical protein
MDRKRHRKGRERETQKGKRKRGIEREEKDRHRKGRERETQKRKRKRDIGR